MAYGKKIITGVDLKTKSGPVMYTNMLGWPPMLGFAYMGGEYRRLFEHMESHSEDGGPLFPKAGLLLLLLGCIVGTGIGVSSHNESISLLYMIARILSVVSNNSVCSP